MKRHALTEKTLLSFILIFWSEIGHINRVFTQHVLSCAIFQDQQSQATYAAALEIELLGL